MPARRGESLIGSWKSLEARFNHRLAIKRTDWRQNESSGGCGTGCLAFGKNPRRGKLLLKARAFGANRFVQVEAVTKCAGFFGQLYR